MSMKINTLVGTNGESQRILLIAPQPFYEDRGTPIVVHDEIRVLGKLGFKVDVVTYPMGSAIDIPNVELVRTANPLRFKSVPVGFSFKKILVDLCLFVTVLRMAWRNHYDCVHGVEEGALIALVCKVLFRIPIIYDMHSSLPEQLKIRRFLKAGAGKWLALYLERLLVRNADGIIASRGLASRVLAIAPGKTVWECYFEGCDRREWDADLARCLDLNGHPTVVYAGNFADYQGLDLLLEAAVQMRAEIPGVVFIFVGGTEQEIARLNRSVKRRELEDVIKLVPRCPRHEVPEYLALADVLVLPRPEGKNAPLKIYDYMKSGKPIVATDISAHTSVLSDRTAILVKPSATALADGITLALRDTEQAHQLALAAEISCQSHTEKPLNKTIELAYQQILPERSSPAFLQKDIHSKTEVFPKRVRSKFGNISLPEVSNIRRDSTSGYS